MALIVIPLANGTYTTDETPGVVTLGKNKGFNHQMTFLLEESTPVTAGTVTVSAKSYGSEEFEPVPDGSIDLTSIGTLIFQFNSVDQYQFVVSGLTGAGRLVIKDSPFGVCQ